MLKISVICSNIYSQQSKCKVIQYSRLEMKKQILLDIRNWLLHWVIVEKYLLCKVKMGLFYGSPILLEKLKKSC